MSRFRNYLGELSLALRHYYWTIFLVALVHLIGLLIHDGRSMTIERLLYFVCILPILIYIGTCIIYPMTFMDRLASVCERRFLRIASIIRLRQKRTFTLN